MFVLVAAICGSFGCSGLDRMSRNVDMASEHINPQKPVYEGQLHYVKRIGPLTALQFTDGQAFDVVECQSSLIPGDRVRIYKQEKGYVAHLWQESKNPLVPGVAISTSAPTLPVLPKK
jgi:hypothetical protein